MATAIRVPLLKDGDRLVADEFMRRYEASPQIKRAELIEGVVHVASPVRFIQHIEPQAMIITWLGYYFAGTPGVRFGGAGTVRLDDRNVYEPDAMLMIDPKRGGRIHFNDGYIEGGPELIVEVSASTVHIDLGKKHQVYRRHGVREYIVWRTLDGAIDWFTLRDGEYLPTPPAEDGLIRSEAFPGLRLDPAALIAGDLPRIFEVVGEGTKSAEHADFVARLNG
jgi:Uma2 family endonuclease